MKKFFCLALLLPLVYVIAGLGTSSLTNTSGPPTGYTGSPADAKTCGTNGGCHFINFKPMPGWISSTVPGSGWVPGITYTITAKVINPIRNKFGFEVSPQSATGVQLGTLIVTNSAETKLASSKYITHTSAGCGGSGSRTWTFNWKAPTAGTGNVTFYGAFNASNANGSSTGDSIYTSTLVIPEDPNISIAENGSAAKTLCIYPNPAKERFSLRSPFTENKAFTMRIANAEGKVILEKQLENPLEQVETPPQAKGLYFVFLDDGTDIVIEKIVLL